MNSKTTKPARVETRVSTFDRFHAALMSLVIMVALVVALLFMIWLATFSDHSVDRTAHFRPEPVPASKVEWSRSVLGQHDEIEPGVDELPEVERPQLKKADLERITDIITNRAEELGRPDGWSDFNAIGPRGGFDHHP